MYVIPFALGFTWQTMRTACACILLLIGCGVVRGQDGVTPTEATLCDLYQFPDRYAGKIIKVGGGSVSALAIDDSRHDSQPEVCPAYMRIVVAFPDQVRPSPTFDIVRDDSYGKLLEALHHGGPIHIDATYEGRFDAAFAWRDHKRVRVGNNSEEGFGKHHEYDGRIVLRKVSDVWAKPLPRK